MTNQTESFYPDFIIIPVQVYRNENLEQLDRLVFGVVYWYAQLKDGKCFASNSAIADVLEVHPVSVGKSLERLEKFDFVKRIFKDEAKRNRTEIECLIKYGSISQKRIKDKTSFSPQADRDQPTDPSLPMRKNKEEEHVQEGEEPAERPHQLDAAVFQSLWKKYPRRRGRRAAERHFKRDIKTNRDFVMICTALDNYLKEIREKKTAMDYILHGSTWFNNWTDYLEVQKPASDAVPFETDAYHPIQPYPAKVIPPKETK